MNFNHVLEFWFKELSPADWWKKDDALDQKIKKNFGALHEKASTCELFPWRSSPEGALAEIIILDQFSRNIFRNTPQAFSADSLALALAQEAVSKKFDERLKENERAFLYMPYMHSESLIIHEEAVKLFKKSGLENNLDYELKHKAIIEKFGRYPHRNEILSRKSTPEEEAFLKTPGSSF